MQLSKNRETVTQNILTIHTSKYFTKDCLGESFFIEQEM